MKAYLIIIRLYFRMLSGLFPRLAASHAFHLFQRPINRVTKPLEKSFLQHVKAFKIPHDPEPIECYELGPEDGRIAILVHGWESNAGSMAAIATSLADQGYRVVTFNLPAHGNSRLKKANLLTCSQVLDRVIRYYQYSGTPSIISHSFGSAVSAFTLAKSGHKIDKFIMLSTPDKITDIFVDFKKTISLGTEAFENLVAKVEGYLGEKLDEVSIARMASRINYDQLSIIHDEFDKVLPYSNSFNVFQQAPKASLTTFEKIGHYRMLWNSHVIQTVLFKLEPGN